MASNSQNVCSLYHYATWCFVFLVCNCLVCFVLYCIKHTCSVDLVRCSIAFDNWEDMEKAILKFVHRINTSQNRYIRKILRIKNGFSMFHNLRYGQKLTLADYNYTDIKINVLISNEDGSIQIIGETQWLLNMMQDV